MRTLFPASLAVAAMGVGAAAAAVELGSLRIRSSIGRPLRLEIELHGTGAAELDTRCLRLRQLSAGDDASRLRGARIGLVTDERHRHIEITTRQAVFDPLLRVVVDATCGTARGWEYEVPLSPPPAGAETPASFAAGAAAPDRWRIGPDESLASIARALYPDSTAMQERFVDSTRRANPGLGVATSDTLAEGTEIVIPDLRHLAQGKAKAVAVPRAANAAAEPAKAAARSGRSQQPEAPRPTTAAPAAVMESIRPALAPGIGDLPRLRLATELAPAPASTETERELLRLEYQVLSALRMQAAGQQDLIDKLRLLERTQAALRGLAGVGAAAAEPAIAVPEPRPAPAKGLSPPTAGWRKLLFGPAVIAAIGVLFLLGGLVVWRKRRPRPDVFADEPVTVLAIEPAAATKSTRPLRRSDSEPPANRIDSREPTLKPLDAQIEEFKEERTVVELAEMMMGFGRVKGAAELLNQYIGSNPGEALKPWTMLLDVYRRAGLAEDFERAARRLHRHFNVQIEEWDDSANLSFVARSIEDYPHIVKQVTTRWRTPECLAYLHHLLRDNRAGERNGFTREVADEMLLLIEIMELDPARMPTADPR